MVITYLIILCVSFLVVRELLLVHVREIFRLVNIKVAKTRLLGTDPFCTCSRNRSFFKGAFSKIIVEFFFFDKVGLLLTSLTFIFRLISFLVNVKESALGLFHSQL